jgi:hypothetical protein
VQRAGRYLDVPLATGGDDRFARRGRCGERQSPFGQRLTVSQEAHGDKSFERPSGVAYR